MKKIALFFGLIIASLNALDSSALDSKMSQNQVIQNQDPLGWFFGVGLGTGVQTWKIKYLDQTMGDDHFFLSDLSMKLGAYHHFNSYFGLRYYYSFDWGYMQGSPENNIINSSKLFPQNDLSAGFFISSQTHMVNLDLTFDVYSQEKQRLDLIVGVGVGVFIPTYSREHDSQRSTIDWVERYSVQFQTQINAGIKMMFNQKYGLELMGKIPVTPAAVISTFWMDNDGNNKAGASTTKVKQIELVNYLVSLSFVMEL